MCDLVNTQRLNSIMRESPKIRHTHRMHHKHLLYVSPRQAPSVTDGT